MKATTNIVPLLEELLSEESIDGDVLSLTSNDGIMLKSWLVDVFGVKISPDVCNMRGMACTKAANCGISSKAARLLVRIDLPDNLNDAVQEKGRVGRGERSRDPRTRGLPDVWHGLVNINSYTQLIVRDENQDSENERKLQVAKHFEILKLYVLPSECYHIALEKEFERPGVRDRQPCGTKCPFCRGKHLLFAGAVKKGNLVNVLSASVLFDGPCAPTTLAKLLWENASKIWFCASDVTGGHAHALVLQLIAADILCLVVKRPSDGAEVTPKDLNVKWSIVPGNANEPPSLAHTVESRWEHINCV